MYGSNHAGCGTQSLTSSDRVAVTLGPARVSHVAQIA
jgi:hypothetical protein